MTWSRAGLLLLTVLLPTQVLAQAAGSPGTWTRVTSNPAQQFDPAISGTLVVYTDDRNGNFDIYSTDTATMSESAITTAPEDQQLSDVSGTRVVYTDVVNTDVLVFDRATGQALDLTDGWNSVSDNPAISGDLVVWQDNRSGDFEIWGKDLATGTLRQISNLPGSDSNPAVSGSRVVWQHCSTGCVVYAYDWSQPTAAPSIVSAAGLDARHPSVSGNLVAYEGMGAATNGLDLFVKDVTSSGAARQLSLAGDQSSPAISGGRVAFDETSNGTSTVRVWDLSATADDGIYDVSKQDALDSASAYLNDIDGDRIVYTRNDGADVDIWMFTFNPAPATPPAAIDCNNLGGSVPLTSQTFTRSSGKPSEVTVTFGGASGVALVCIDNGSGASSRATSAKVSLNGATIARERDFNRNVSLVQGFGRLTSHNELGVLLNGSPGSGFTVTVYAAQAKGPDITVRQHQAAERGDEASGVRQHATHDEQQYSEATASATSAGGGTSALQAAAARVVNGDDAEPMPGYGCSAGGPGSLIAIVIGLAALLPLVPRPVRATRPVRSDRQRRR